MSAAATQREPVGVIGTGYASGRVGFELAGARRSATA